MSLLFVVPPAPPKYVLRRAILSQRGAICPFQREQYPMKFNYLAVFLKRATLARKWLLFLLTALLGLILK